MSHFIIHGQQPGCSTAGPKRKARFLGEKAPAPRRRSGGAARGGRGRVARGRRRCPRGPGRAPRSGVALGSRRANCARAAGSARAAGAPPAPGAWRNRSGGRWRGGGFVGALERRPAPSFAAGAREGQTRGAPPLRVARLKSGPKRATADIRPAAARPLTLAAVRSPRRRRRRHRKSPIGVSFATRSEAGGRQARQQLLAGREQRIHGPSHCGTGRARDRRGDRGAGEGRAPAERARAGREHGAPPGDR